MRFWRKLIFAAGLAGAASASLSGVQAEQPATDARLLESAVDRLGLLAAAPASASRVGATSTRTVRSPGSPGRSASSPSHPAAPRSTTAKTAPRSSTGPAARRLPTAPHGTLRPTTPAGDELVLLEPEATAAELDPIEVKPGSELTSEQAVLRDRVRRVLGQYYPRHLNTRDHNPWEVMHGIVAFGVDAKIRRGGPDGDAVNAIAYLSTNGRMNGLQLLLLERGRIQADKGPKVQGHYGQLLAILAQSRVKTDYPLHVNGKSFTLADLIETEKRTCRSGIELTFKLISFAHYLDSDAVWTNESGEKWDIPKLIAEELKQPILSNAACGGTHRLMGFAYAVRNRKKQGRPIEGQWLRAAKYLDEYHSYTFALQNPDGSFSTEWFRRREAKDDINRRLQTTGHILEWMAYSLPEKQLDDPRLLKAVSYLSGILAAEPTRAWEIGPLGHALHALSIYDQRRYKPLDDEAQVDIAQSESEPVASDEAEEAAAAEIAAEPAVDEESHDTADSGPILRLKR